MSQHAVIGQVYDFRGTPVTAVRYVKVQEDPCHFCAIHTSDGRSDDVCDSMPSCMRNDVVFLAAERADEYSVAKIVEKLIGEQT